MDTCFSEEQKRDFVKRGFSRRTFGRLAAVLTAGASLPFYNESAMAQLSAIRPASGFLLVAQSKATRREGFSYNSGFIPPRRSRLGTND
jgi:hypothetical protein